MLTKTSPQRNKYIANLVYLLKHKWYVYQECASVGLWWLGIIHDISKFLPSEFIAYARFFGKNPDADKARGWEFMQQEIINHNFNVAWITHQHKNKHHWQYWVLREDDGRTKPLPMPAKYRMEMLCDWIGAGKAQGFTRPNECRLWYLTNKDKMILHRNTRDWIEKQLQITKEK